MNNKSFILIIFLLFCVSLMSNQAQADNLSFGVSAGPALGFNSDFNNENTRTGFHFALGVDLLYRLPCRSGKFCESLFVDANFTWLMPSTYSFGDSQIKNTGIVGRFSEKQFAYGASISIRKHFMPENRLHFFASMGLGFEYFQISNSSFTDSLGSSQPLNIKKNSLNMSVVPQVGLTYQISHKLSVDISAQAHTTIPSLFKNSYIVFPIGLKYTF